MKIHLLVACIASSTFSTVLCMKRKRTDSILSSDVQHKKSKNSSTLRPLHLHNFFAIHQKCCNLFPKTQQKFAETCVAQLPKDVKNTIAAHLYKKQPSLYLNYELNYNQPIYGLSFSSNNQLTIGYNNYDTYLIERIDVQDGTTSTFQGDGEILCLAYSLDKSLLAYGLDSGEVFVVDKEMNQKGYYKVEQSVWALCFNENNTQLAIGTAYRKKVPNVYLFDLLQHRCILSRNAGHNVYGVFFPSLDTITYAQSNGTLKTYTVSQKTLSIQRLKELDDKRQLLLALAHNKNATLCALGLAYNSYKNNYVEIDDTVHHQITILPTSSKVYSLAFSDDGQELAVGLENGNVQLFYAQKDVTPQQTMLRTIISLWLRVEKPNQYVNNIQKLLITLSNKFSLNHQELVDAWNTFSLRFQIIFWNHIDKIIKKYGK